MPYHFWRFIMETERTNPYRDARSRGVSGGGPLGNMRASDADREAMAETLRRHYAAGRLDAEEFDERIGRCYTAKRLSELDELLADLPREPAPQPEQRRERPCPPWSPGREWAIFVPIVIGLIALCALTGAHLVWLAFPLFFFVVGPWRWRRGWRGAGRGTP
jgi:hypothetical protein